MSECRGIYFSCTLTSGDWVFMQVSMYITVPLSPVTHTHAHTGAAECSVKGRGPRVSHFRAHVPWPTRVSLKQARWTIVFIISAFAPLSLAYANDQIHNSKFFGKLIFLICSIRGRPVEDQVPFLSTTKKRNLRLRAALTGSKKLDSRSSGKRPGDLNRVSEYTCTSLLSRTLDPCMIFLGLTIRIHVHKVQFLQFVSLFCLSLMHD